MHGDEDAIRPRAQGVALAEATGGSFVAPGLRPPAAGADPVVINRLVYEFVKRLP